MKLKLIVLAGILFSSLYIGCKSSTSGGDGERITITIESTTGGSTEPQNSFEAEKNQTDTISAEPITGYLFIRWEVTSGSAEFGDPTEVTTTVEASEDATIRAVFERNQYQLTMEAGTGGTVTPSDRKVSHGVSYSITATSKSDSTFDNWTISGNGTITNNSNANTTVRLTGDATVTANFIEIKKVTLITVARIGGTVTPDSSQYNTGDTVAIKATAKTDSVFEKWTISGEGTIADSTKGSTTVSLTGDATAMAHFKAIVHTLVVKAMGGGTASLDTNMGITGTEITAKAEAKADSIFDKWTITGSSTLADSSKDTTKVTFAGSDTVTAHFRPITYKLTTLAVGGGTVSPDTVTEVKIGEKFTIVAKAKPDSMFDRWERTGLAPIADTTKDSTTVQLHGDGTVTAFFKKILTPPTVVGQKDTMVTFNTNVTLTAIGADADGTVEKYIWQYNNGLSDTTTTGTIDHTFPSIFNWLVTVKTVDDEGAESPLDTFYVDTKHLVFIDARDDQTYTAVKIGTETVMAQNLNYTQDSAACYSNNDNNCLNGYGRLYTWRSATSSCPTGWHLPTVSEWTSVFNVAGTWNGSEWAGAGTKLRSANFKSGADTYGFGALAAGMYSIYGSFISRGSDAVFWSSTKTQATFAQAYIIGGANTTILKPYAGSFERYYSVRCFQGTAQAKLTTAAGTGGTVNPTTPGNQGMVNQGEEISISGLNSTVNYTFEKWTINGFGVIADSTNFNTTVKIWLDDTVTAVFKQIGFTDARDSKSYKMVTIGTQTWMAQNLNYDAGAGSYCYGTHAPNCNTYGRLYDWATAMNNAASSANSPSGVQGVCPSGWHMPSNNEWETLAAFVGTDTGDNGKQQGGSTWLTLGKHLKKSQGWNTSPQNPQKLDTYGFAAIAGGIRTGNFGDIGTKGYWWSTTELAATTAFYRNLRHDNDQFYRPTTNKTDAMAVRCILD